jgi:hypothetical protein
MLTRWFNFYPDVHVFANTLVPVVSTAHLVVRRANRRFISLAHTLGAARTYPQVRVAQWHALLELLFAAPMVQAQYPSQILLRSSAQSSCGLHNEELTTKPSRRWQPLIVTSTTGLQLDHLVPLDAISQYNRTRITHSQSIHTLASTCELEGSQSHSSMDAKSPKVLNLSQARAPHLFIAQRPNRAVAQKLALRAPNHEQ